jgi:GTP-binding protein HflX
MIPTRKKPERVITVGAAIPGFPRWEAEESLRELGQLVEAAGGTVVHSLLQERESIDVTHFIGKGKVEEVARAARAHHADTVIFDHELSPGQVRNLENAVEKKVLDRSELILDIFAQHARTKTAKIQVEAAQLEYMLPRLTRLWVHLSRLGGGIGTRGPGETQLEVDRRRIRHRLHRLRRALKAVERSRKVQRGRRKGSFRAVLVGYTNAGKTSLLNALAHTDVPTADRPFVTLDSTTRRTYVEDHKRILLTDTVGFIRRLPHHLIASFHSTLEEAIEADMLLHVVDLQSPHFEEQIGIVDEVLGELGAGDNRRLLVLNKADLLDAEVVDNLLRRYPQAVATSAIRGTGLDDLRAAIRDSMETPEPEQEPVFARQPTTA